MSAAFRDGEPVPSYTSLDTVPEPRGECPNCDGSGETIELIDVGVGNMERREVCSICGGTGEAVP